jgi:hypothetical protein
VVQPQRQGRLLAARSPPATEDQAADGEPETERPERKRPDRDEPPPEREALPAADHFFLLGRERLTAPLLTHSAASLETEVDVVEELRRLVRHGPSV